MIDGKVVRGCMESLLSGMATNGTLELSEGGYNWWFRGMEVPTSGRERGLGT